MRAVQQIDVTAIGVITALASQCEVFEEAELGVLLGLTAALRAAQRIAIAATTT
jgi:hypothetical protein